MNKQEIINYLNNRNVYADVSIEEMAEVLAVKPRPKGKWIFVQYDANPNIGNYHCSCCRFIPVCYIEFQRTNFCPNCGAKMGN